MRFEGGLWQARSTPVILGFVADQAPRMTIEELGRYPLARRRSDSHTPKPQIPINPNQVRA